MCFPGTCMTVWTCHLWGLTLKNSANLARCLSQLGFNQWSLHLHIMVVQFYIPIFIWFRHITIQSDAFCNLFCWVGCADCWLFMGMEVKVCLLSGQSARRFCPRAYWPRWKWWRKKCFNATSWGWTRRNVTWWWIKASKNLKLKMERSSWRPCNGPKLSSWWHHHLGHREQQGSHGHGWHAKANAGGNHWGRLCSFDWWQGGDVGLCCFRRWF